MLASRVKIFEKVDTLFLRHPAVSEYYTTSESLICYQTETHLDRKYKVVLFRKWHVLLLKKNILYVYTFLFM